MKARKIIGLTIGVIVLIPALVIFLLGMICVGALLVLILPVCWLMPDEDITFGKVNVNIQKKDNEFKGFISRN